MLQFFANVHSFCLLRVSGVSVGQFFANCLPADGTPIIQKGAAFIYIFNYQVVTSENENKFRVFSPFPQPPPVDLAGIGSFFDLASKVQKRLTSLL